VVFHLTQAKEEDVSDLDHRAVRTVGSAKNTNGSSGIQIFETKDNERKMLS